ncbi:endoplasmic reticulum junction formation protein lunapark-A-like isoform X2 [Palaemon carinicauda]|uniref:endoplasmic reticulum junction formation protein lunapark-A-like isoform X2 n=1 Tax=Palaemon carinicauda TaxID=392227 RepID=UPI0035B583CF
MGLILSRFRKKQSTKEVLEQIQKDVLDIQEYHIHTQQRQKRLIGSLVLYSIVLYLVAAVVFYFYYFPPTLQEQLLYATPFIVFPLVVYILKRLLTWYYRRKISKNEQKLKSLRERKTKILEQVMETETYKVAKEILETYAPDQLHRSQMHKSQAVITPAPQRLPSPSSTHPDVRRRVVPPMSTPQTMAQPPRPLGPQNLPHQTPVFPVRPSINSQSSPPRPGITGMSALRSTPAGPVNVPPGVTPKFSATPAQPHHPTLTRPGSGLGLEPGVPGSEGPPGPPMPRPVLPRERGYLDRFVEYLVGDGPANRFALVCRQCESHNGMALKDEFPYLAFRCAYCFYWNPARKQRPFAPRLETITPQLPPPIPASEDQEEEEDEEEDEEEQEEQDSSSGEEEEEEEEEEEGGAEEEESSSSSSAEDQEEEEEEEGAVSSSELSSNKATSSQEGSLEDVAKSTPSSEPSSSDDHQNFVEVFCTSSSSRTNHMTSTTMANTNSVPSPSSSNTASTTETEETE